MIESAKLHLQELGIADRFELVCADIFDEQFLLPEQVDCVVLSYTITTFINNYNSLASLLKQCSKQLKPNGYLMVADFTWVDQPKDNFWAGMYTSTQHLVNGTHKEFAPFQFFIDRAPDCPFDIFHIPSYLMFKAGRECGFKNITYKEQYPNPDYKNDPVVRRYFDQCDPEDYLIKFKFN
eukprot:CAMPEP_0116974540 /NCGR_PEP_ID=MMETSP0467-20121206/55234_1 /TAXON_ID=283647 /ORGANISM="Mesodinium pulex, Strain SPMC105" /LENGTH=179 /DNA_ID=CAMNT_0004666713 /DNA_START=246 /DNA_END=785 /DNA_ORIENTATION=+